MQNKEIQLSGKELLFMSKLYSHAHFPHNFATLEELAGLIGVSRDTASKIGKELEKRGLVTKQNAFVVFYYPINDLFIRRAVLVSLGFIN